MYSADYLTFDSFGISEVRCMRCNTPVAVRDYVEVRGEKVLGMRKLSNWRYRMVEMDNGTYADAIICQDCESKSVEDEKLLEQIKKGWVQELQTKGVPKETMDAHNKRWEKVAVKKVKAVENPVEIKGGA